MEALVFSLLKEPIFMLCVMLGGATGESFGIDLVDSGGPREHYRIVRTSSGFDVYDEQLSKTRRVASITRKGNVFRAVRDDGRPVAPVNFDTGPIRLPGKESQGAPYKLVVTKRGPIRYIRATPGTGNWATEMTFIVRPE